MDKQNEALEPLSSAFRLSEINVGIHATRYYTKFRPPMSSLFRKLDDQDSLIKDPLIPYNPSPIFAFSPCRIGISK
jgi:hypothetical protein